MLKLLTLFGGVALTVAPVTSFINYSHSDAQIVELKNVDKNSELDDLNSNQKTELNLTQSLQKKNNQSFQNSINSYNDGGGIIGQDATTEQIKNFSYLVPNYQWFTKLVSSASFGYTEAPQSQILKEEQFGKNSTGLCEYIALSTVITYHELFVSSGYFTDHEWEGYFDDPIMSGNQVGLSAHNNYGSVGKKENSFINKLWVLNDKKKNLKTGADITHPFKLWVKGKTIASIVDYETCAPIMHSSNPETYLMKYNFPVILTTGRYGGHSVVVYGYDNKTNSYLVHYGWSNHPAVIIKKDIIWNFFFPGFWNAFFYSSNPPSTNLRQAFGYQNQKYSWKELEAKGITWDQVLSL